MCARAGNAVVLFGCACEADGALVACMEITGIACSCAAHFLLPIGVGRWAGNVRREPTMSFSGRSFACAKGMCMCVCPCGIVVVYFPSFFL